jgi:hypothetical protein
MSAKLVQTFADRGCRVVSATDPHGRSSRIFRPGAATFPFKWLLSYTHEAEWTPFQTPDENNKSKFDSGRNCEETGVG